MVNLPNQDLAKRQLVKDCMFSLPLTGQALFSSRFHRPFSPNHYKVFDLLADKTKQYKAIAAHRGFGKSSIVDLLLPAHGILFQQRRHIVVIGCSARGAIMQTENLKDKLVNNPKVLDLFGTVEGDSFAKDLWIAKSPTGIDTMVHPRGSGQQVRSSLYGDWRPDLIIVDDLEDPENVLSDEQRAKQKEWFFSDVLGAIDLGSKEWEIVAIGTIVHEDSLIANLVSEGPEFAEWSSLVLPLCDEDGHTNWREFMTDEQIEAKRKELEAKGLEDVFAREYLCLSISPTKRSFARSMFIPYNEAEEKLWTRRTVETLVLVDPAKTTKMVSDDSAIVGISFDTAPGILYVRDVVRGKMHPDNEPGVGGELGGLYYEAIEMCKRLGARILGIEVTSLHEHITYPMEDAIRRSGVPIQLIDLLAKTKKDSKEKRIGSLLPFYRQGLVRHNPACCRTLENQLLWWPKSKKKDVSDALSYFVSLLDEGEVFVNFAPEGVEPEDIYEELAREDEKMGELREEDWAYSANYG